MNKKIIVALIVLLFCVGCLGIVSAENSTNETLENNESEIVDMANYIIPISVTNDEIEFSDGFTGFYLDLTKDSITTGDRFVSENTGSDELQNYVKLAIIEAYRQGCEYNLGQIIDIFASGDYKNSDNKVVSAVLDSQETIGDSAVVELEDSIGATFEFELLKDADGKKSDCLAYKVSLKEMPDDAKLAAITDDGIDGENNDTDNNTPDDNEKATESADNETDEKQDNEKTADADDNKTDDKQEDKKADVTDNKTDEKQDNEKTANTTDNNQKKETLVNETNKTIINKTNTLIINENNTTTINKNNTKIINKTTKTPQNESIPEKLIKTVGNPIFILIVVIAIAAIVAVAIQRKE
ncbi:hypothetical protein [Methanobrevibacter sp.]|uniref:hypothetical protein n=1 Tax=Methanobrevibacter sp. TaxID=66852 RepID=UPI00386CB50A